MTEIPTVKVIKAGSRLGYCIINESDFDPKVHKKWVEPKRKSPRKVNQNGD